MMVSLRAYRLTSLSVNFYLIIFRIDDANENKAHPDHIQAEPNGFPGGNGRVLSSPIHKSSRLNGVAPRMNITSNPLAQDGGDKVATARITHFYSLALTSHLN